MTNHTTSKTRLFEAGILVSTPAANDLGIDLRPYLRRHLAGDWGDCSAEDRKENDFAIGKELRIFSAYQTPNGKLWIITEADRSSTCILLPSDY